jgi:hypothetical protein
VPERGDPAGVPRRDLAPAGGSGGLIYSDPVFWRVAPLVALTAGSHVAIQTLWAGPWLSDVAGMGRDAVAANLAAMAIGFLIGTLVMGASPTGSAAAASGCSRSCWAISRPS